MKNCNLWQAVYYDTKNKKQTHIGTYKTEKDAKKGLDNYGKQT